MGTSSRDADETCWTNAVSPRFHGDLRRRAIWQLLQMNPEVLWQEFGASRRVSRVLPFPISTVDNSFRLCGIGHPLLETLEHAQPDDPSIGLGAFFGFGRSSAIRFRHRGCSIADGERYQELRESGLLQSVAGVPWFAGRRMEFSGG